MLQVEKSQIVIPNPGQYCDVQKAAIAQVKTSDMTIFILRGDDRLEVYRGTSHTKQGWFKITYDPGYRRKRPGIPQWEFKR